jgi:hypothetical protein
MPPVLNECKRLITTVIWRMLHRMPYIASMIKGFFQLLLVLILCFCAEVFGQQSIPDRCEALLAAPPRPEGNQPIPEQLKIPEAPKTARQVSCFRSFSRNSTMIDVVRKCGVPDKHMGSGVYLFGYYMTDCSTVSIATPDLRHLGINYVKQGKTTVLLSECTDQQATQAEENTDNLNNWSDVYQSFNRFSQCDDGSIAEGYSDAVGRLLADNWDQVTDLARLAARDKSFQSFVLRHVDETLSPDTLKKIVQNAKHHCHAETAEL